MNHFFVCIVLVMFSMLSFAEKTTVKNWLKDSNSWHFYNEKSPEDKQAIEAIAKEYAIYMGTSEHAPMSSAWIKENLPKFRQLAGDNPTSDNVLAMLYMEKVIRDRGKVLAQAAVRFASADPYLDASHKSVSTQMGSLEHRAEYIRRRESVVDKLLSSREVGLWIFYNSENCLLCEQSFRIYDELIRKHNTPAIIVATDNKAPTSQYLKGIPVKFDKKKAEEFNIKTFPAVFAYNLKNKEFLQITRGLVSKNMFYKSILNAASFAGWLDKETENYINVLYDPYSFSELKIGDTPTENFNSSDIVNMVKSHMDLVLKKEES